MTVGRVSTLDLRNYGPRHNPNDDGSIGGKWFASQWDV